MEIEQPEINQLSAQFDKAFDLYKEIDDTDLEFNSDAYQVSVWND